MRKKEGELSIVTGNAFLYYCYDVGTGFDIDGAEKALGGDAERISLGVERLAPTYIQYRKRPLLVRLGHISVNHGMNLEGVAKIYDFGVITIRLRMPLHGAFAGLKQTCLSINGSTALQDAAQHAFRALYDRVKQFTHDPYMHDDVFEDYVITHVEHFDKHISGAELMTHHARTIADALRCEKNELSQMELNESLKNPLSYFADDLAVVDSGAAFIYSPRHAYDVHDVIEYALIELLELRHYDGVLDDALEQAHADVHGTTLSLNPFSRPHRELAKVRLEVTNVVEKVENALKLIGDMYLAKVYTVAAERFGLQRWKESVRSKLATVQSVYEVLINRINGRRLMILEIVIAISSVIFIIEFFLNYSR